MDSLTADLILRNQNVALAEAEELIQSWLTGVEDGRTAPAPCIRSHDSSVHARAEEHPVTTPQQAMEKVHRQQFHKGLLSSHHLNSDFGSTTPELYHSANLGHLKHTPFDPTLELKIEATGFEGSFRREPDDYLSGLDWSDGDVGMNARAIVDRLMKTSSVDMHHVKTVGGGKRSHDPRVTMEMRHREVQQRRKAKDKERSRQKQSQLAAREAQREAEMVVRREEERNRRQRAREEVLIREEMATIRREMRDNQQKKVFESKLSSLSVEHPESEAVLQCASEVVKREARRRETRTELVKQLHEAEATEAKDKLKLLHWSFSRWYTLVVESRAKLGKATAIGDWKLLLRVWQAWRTFVSERRERKERDRLARELQRERTCTDLARRHHAHRLLLRCFSSWLHLMRTSQGRRKVEMEAARRQEKMATLLQAAAQGRLTSSSSVGGLSNQSSPAGDGRKDVPEKLPATKQAEDTGEHGGRVEPTVASGRPEPIIWQTARQQLDKLLLDGSKRRVVTLQDKHGGKGGHKLEPGYHCSGDKPDATAEHNLQATPEHEMSFTSGGHPRATPLTSEEHPRATSPRPEIAAQSRENRRSATPNLVSSAVVGAVRRPRPRPATKPIPMSGMEMRSMELSRRREAREQRKRELELERVARLQCEEEEKREAERKAREVLTTQRREERRIARQRELEHQQRQQRLAELTCKAVRHYEHVLVKNRGLKPWRKFVELVRGQCSRAEAFHDRWLLRGAFLPWRGATVLRVQGKETKADSLHRVALMRRAMHTWKQQVEHTHSLEDLAVLRHPTLLLGCVFRGWRRVTREERVRMWEQERRAKKHHERTMKYSVLRAWVRFVPLSREEKVKELHRAELRRKVAAWLPDYQPRNFGQDQAEPG